MFMNVGVDWLVFRHGNHACHPLSNVLVVVKVACRMGLSRHIRICMACLSNDSDRTAEMPGRHIAPTSLLPTGIKGNIYQTSLPGDNISPQANQDQSLIRLIFLEAISVVNFSVNSSSISENASERDVSRL